MTERTAQRDVFPPGDFDAWAETYDQDVVTENKFPFEGYERVLDTTVQLAAAAPGMSVLDIGTGTGNLAARFAHQGCDVWCTDFSMDMLDKARAKLPGAHFVHQDLRAGWPAGLSRLFDRVVSAYVFHHFELNEKVSLCTDMLRHHLQPGGRLVIADLSFAGRASMDAFARSLGDLWEEEPYWLADESLEALRQAGLKAQYVSVAGCAGVYCLESDESLRR